MILYYCGVKKKKHPSWRLRNLNPNVHANGHEDGLRMIQTQRSSYKVCQFSCNVRILIRHCGHACSWRPHCRTEHSGRQGAALAQEGGPEIERGISFWKYKLEWDSFGDTQLVFGPNEICVWLRQTPCCSPFSHRASDPKAHRSALESKGSYWKPLGEFFKFTLNLGRQSHFCSLLPVGLGVHCLCIGCDPRS